MYQIKEAVYLSEEENEKLLSKELALVKVNHVKTEEEVPLEEYSYKYEVGKDLDLF